MGFAFLRDSYSARMLSLFIIGNILILSHFYATTGSFSQDNNNMIII